MAPARTGPPNRPAIRLRPAPPLDPPYDDETTQVAWACGVDGQLTLDLPVRSGSRRPPGPGTAPDVPPVPRLPLGALATATPEARRAARRFLDTCLEIVNGYRPAAQVRVLASPGAAHVIINQLSAARVRLAGPGRRTDRPRAPVQLRLLRVCEPRPGVAEAAAALGQAGRTWAMAFRLERRNGSWLGTVAQLL